MRDLLDKLNMLEGFMPEHMEGEVEFEFTGDDGETQMGTLHYKAEIKQSDEHGYYAEVDPKSLKGECEPDGNAKVDDDLATYTVQPGETDHEAAMEAAFEDAMDEIKNADNKYSHGESIDDSDTQTEDKDRIIFKGKEIDLTKIDYTMRDFSDGMIELNSPVFYTDGTEVDDEDLNDLNDMPEMLDWMMQDYMDNRAPQEEAAVAEDEKPTDEEILALADRYKQYEGGNGDSLLGGYIQYMTNTGVPLDSIEEGEWNKWVERNPDAEFPGMDVLDQEPENFPITVKFRDDLFKMYKGMPDEDDCHRISDVIDSVEENAELDRIKGLSGLDTNEEGEVAEDKIKPGQGALDKFRELYRKGIGSDDDEVVLRELIEVINDDALFADEFTQLRQFTDVGSFGTDEVLHAKNVPGDTADEKIETLIKTIGDDGWVESFAKMLMWDFSMDENAELDRIKELSGVDTNEEDEQTFEGDEFYEYYGYLPWHEDLPIDEAEYRGRKVKLGKPMRGDVKKFKVFVRDPKTKNIKKVNFGDPNMRIKKSNPKRRKSFRARHNCDNPGPRTKARYWSCRKW
jgi:hypothetical protein